jgi:hypothetical protein
VLLAATVAVLALPSGVLAYATGFDPSPNAAISDDGEFLPASVDPRLARSISVRTLSKGRLFQFTPAASPTRSDRSVTIAVRVEPGMAGRLIASRSAAQDLGSQAALRIAPNSYSLGASRGYQGFALGAVRKGDVPDLSAFRPSPGAAPDPARFVPRLALDEREKTGRLPRTTEGQGEQTVDVGGAYRLTRNLDVTAGVRYRSDRDRMGAVADQRQDSQAVYVGTQFRF